MAEENKNQPEEQSENSASDKEEKKETINKAGKKKSNKTIYLVLILILALLNGFLYYQNVQKEQEKENIETKLRSAEDLKADLEKEYLQTLDELEKYKGKNAQLDSVLQQRIAELESKRSEIENLLKKNRITASELAKARSQIAELRVARDIHLNQLDSLAEANQILTTENVTLKERLDVEKEHTEKITKEKEKLETKVKKGSILEVEELTASGIKVKGSGKETETSNANKTEKIRICVTLDENRVLDPGQQTLLLRLVGPDGATIAVESYGSGKFTDAETGEEKQYSMKTNIDYDNQSKKVCMFWEQNNQFAEGSYTAEVYHRGHLIGQERFELKTGLFVF